MVVGPWEPSTVALSTTEAEYIALTHVAKQLTWIRRLLNEIGLEQRDPTVIRCDNLSAITITRDVTYVPCTHQTHKHLLPLHLQESGFKRSITYIHRIEGQYCGHYDESNPSGQP